MANEAPKASQSTRSHPRPRWTGFYIERNWYCTCPLKAQPLHGNKGDGTRELFWICSKHREDPERCKFSVWKSDEAEAILYLEEQAEPVPPALEELIERLRTAAPKTPSKVKVDNSITPWSIAKGKPLSRKTSGEGQKSDGGVGRAPREGQAVMDLTSSEDDSDPPPAKRARFSSSPPVAGGAPRKARVEFHTPMGSPNLSTPSRSPVRRLATPEVPERRLATPEAPMARMEMTAGGRIEGWRTAPRGSLPTPETGHRAERVDKGKEKEVIGLGLASVLQSPINLDSSNSDSDSDTPNHTPPTPSHRAKRTSKQKTKSKGKGKRKRTESPETPPDLAAEILDILGRAGHELKESTEEMIKHEIEVAMDIGDASVEGELEAKNAKIKACERTIERLRGKLDASNQARDEAIRERDESKKTFEELTAGWE